MSEHVTYHRPYLSIYELEAISAALAGKTDIHATKAKYTVDKMLLDVRARKLKGTTKNTAVNTATTAGPAYEEVVSGGTDKIKSVGEDMVALIRQYAELSEVQSTAPKKPLDWSNPAPLGTLELGDLD